jgi:hypothetical protein
MERNEQVLEGLQVLGGMSVGLGIGFVEKVSCAQYC